MEKYHTEARFPKTKSKLTFTSPTVEAMHELVEVLTSEGVEIVECYTYESVDRKVKLEHEYTSV